MSASLRVVLCDDSGIFRDGLQLLLERAGVDVAASVSDVAALHAAVAEQLPDVAVVDVRMPPTHTDEGIRAAVSLRRSFPQVGVLVLSTYVDAAWALALLDAVPDSVGYLLKDRVDDVAGLLAALERVARGGVALDAEVVASLVATRRHTEPLEQLTERERAVLAAMAQGLSNSGIAQTLFVSVKTVETHVAAVFRTLGLQESSTDNRRVKAALVYLGAQSDPRLARAFLGPDPRRE
ncbi:response regulator transcription factor [Cellulomonas sp. URHD0024]|uniref:response regulator transcription factor n=1 Tax=Cellulomonas sp. URHD0024 TaxID=1302620 RepID=UPI00041056DE|nr:response regulator transcription factor [Cellulomonas sp. URHD0024]